MTQEIFAVLDGRVEMKYRLDGQENSTVLDTGDIFYASVGTEHIAHPIGQARILVIEKQEASSYGTAEYGCRVTRQFAT